LVSGSCQKKKVRKGKRGRKEWGRHAPPKGGGKKGKEDGKVHLWQGKAGSGRKLGELPKILEEEICDPIGNERKRPSRFRERGGKGLPYDEKVFWVQIGRGGLGVKRKHWREEGCTTITAELPKKRGDWLNP